MSDYSSMATLQNNSQPPRLAAAVERAKLIAAKIAGGGSKRPLEEGPESSAKKVASLDFPYQSSSSMSSSESAAAAAAAAASRIAASLRGSTTPTGSSAPSNTMPDQTLNEYIRVPDKMVGLIIGRGGEQITRLQAESGCKIQMAPDSGGQPDRVCTLTGSREAIARARELVNQIVNHRGRENAPGLDAPGNSSMNPPMPRGGGGGGLAVTEEIILPGPKVGLIIGKNGKTIKQLQEQSGAKMVVIQDGPNAEYEKPLRISGDPSKVEHAKQLVFELLADKDMQQGGGQRQYDDVYSPQDQGNGLATNSTEVLVPKSAVGLVIGHGGNTIKMIQAETGCRVQFHQERDDGPGDKRCYLQGKPHQVDEARQMIEDLIASANKSDQDSRGSRKRGGGNGGGQRNGDRGDYQQWQDSPEVRVTFTVSNVKCGLIIGRGGEVIKQINAQSGAHCELDRKAQDSDRNNRSFYIRGRAEAVEHCKRIIMEKVGMPVNFIPDGGNNGENMGPGSGPGSGPGDYYGGGNGNGGGGGCSGGGGGGGGPPAWGYNPQWHQQAPQQQPQPQASVNPSTGQLDYSREWIYYYRSLGMIPQAEAIEQQVKQQGSAGSDSGTPTGGSTPAPAQAPSPAASGSASGSGATADYSVQWAEYYRNIGKTKEAEAIEAQIKLKQQQQQQAAAAAAAAAAAGVGGVEGAGGLFAAPYGAAYSGGPYAPYAPYGYGPHLAPPAPADHMHHHH